MYCIYMHPHWKPLYALFMVWLVACSQGQGTDHYVDMQSSALFIRKVLDWPKIMTSSKPTDVKSTTYLKMLIAIRSRNPRILWQSKDFVHLTSSYCPCLGLYLIFPVQNVVFSHLLHVRAVSPAHMVISLIM